MTEVITLCINHWKTETLRVQGEAIFAFLPQPLGPLRHASNRWNSLSPRVLLLCYIAVLNGQFWDELPASETRCVMMPCYKVNWTIQCKYGGFHRFQWWPHVCLECVLLSLAFSDFVSFHSLYQIRQSRKICEDLIWHFPQYQNCFGNNSCPLALTFSVSSCV